MGVYWVNPVHIVSAKPYRITITLEMNEVVICSKPQLNSSTHNIEYKTETYPVAFDTWWRDEYQNRYTVSTDGPEPHRDHYEAHK